MNITSRKEAYALGDKFYFTGEICTHGHLVRRYASSGRCFQCNKDSDRRFKNANREKVNKLSAKFKRNHPGKRSAWNAKRRAAKLQRTPLWADLGVIRAFYERRPPGHHVDHILPLQGKFISGLHVIENLQYLPGEENESKSNRIDLSAFETGYASVCSPPLKAG